MCRRGWFATNDIAMLPVRMRLPLILLLWLSTIHSGGGFQFHHHATTNLKSIHEGWSLPQNIPSPLSSIESSHVGYLRSITWDATATPPTNFIQVTANPFFYQPFPISSSDSAAWSNPVTERLKGMVAATLWVVPLLLVLLVVAIAVLFSTVMPVIDKMFYETLEQELQLYLPCVWNEYQEKLNGETLSTRRDLQMELWDQLTEYKAERLREIYENRRKKSESNSRDYYQGIWELVDSQLEEGEELENRPDLIAQLEEGLLKRRQDKGAESSDISSESSRNTSNASTSNNGFQKIVGNELNRVDLIMRLFDKSTEYTGTSRQQIYKDWEKERTKGGKLE
ncbi:hypothetical protein IV203_016957 [Nitzschia inconspicua]|uniref:Uncharacterized protein n=1 Tax=Nitzschia inconspicua TaxID=303405 RepID=A0A9K3PHV6_9STRA|nr:hypothetical protein IV203_016957 [Nitzschia inconspicua]